MCTFEFAVAYAAWTGFESCAGAEMVETRRRAEAERREAERSFALRHVAWRLCGGFCRCPAAASRRRVVDECVDGVCPARAPRIFAMAVRVQGWAKDVARKARENAETLSQDGAKKGRAQEEVWAIEKRGACTICGKFRCWHGLRGECDRPNRCRFCHHWITEEGQEPTADEKALPRNTRKQKSRKGGKGGAAEKAALLPEPWVPDEPPQAQQPPYDNRLGLRGDLPNNLQHTAMVQVPRWEGFTGFAWPCAQVG